MMLILRACLVWLLAAPAPLHASCAALYITVWHWKRAPAQLLTRQELEEPVIGGFARFRHSAGAGAIGSSTKDALIICRFFLSFPEDVNSRCRLEEFNSVELLLLVIGTPLLRQQLVNCSCTQTSPRLSFWLINRAKALLIVKYQFDKS